MNYAGIYDITAGAYPYSKGSIMPLKIEKIAARHQGTIEFLSRHEFNMLIDGEWVSAQNEKRFNSLNPATGEVIASIPAGDARDIDAAVNAAKNAIQAGAWASFSPSDRAKVMWRIADLMERHIDELAELETIDQGKALYVGRYAEIPNAIEQFRYFSGQATKIEGATIPTSIDYQPKGKKVFAYTRKEPVGVVGVIVPWNSPIVLSAMNIAPALAAGCSVVLKPAEDTSLTAIRLGELMIEAGLPSGVINIVTGVGSAAGEALAEHKLVDKIAFTGSTVTGKKVLEAAKSNLKKVSLELGGKSPVIILDDADMDLAITGAANSIFFNGGQVCVAGSRLYVQRKRYEQVVEGIVSVAKAIKLGNGLALDTQMGPLVNKIQADKVSGYINRACSEGAALLQGGQRLGDVGNFFEPSVLANVRQDMEIVRDEVFGPVLVCSPFDEIDEVPDMANDTEYGLAASVWTENLSYAHRLAETVRAGTVWINCHSMYDPSLPIGGMKQSGWGRLCGTQAVESFLETKTVCAVL